MELENAGMPGIRRMKESTMSYLIPWWDDYVDSHYNFITDEPTTGRKVTSHEIYEQPPYDGILVSRGKIEDNKKRFGMIQSAGVHEYVNFNGPVFGDCGAYGYIKEKEPPYSPTEIADYYDSIGFDYGVSVDHLIVSAVMEQKHERFDLTLRNAEQFIHHHEGKGYEFIPVGAAQGWDRHSYAQAVEELLDMNYQYIAIGGLTRSQTPHVLEVLSGVNDVVKAKRRGGVGIHLFGIARLGAVEELRRFGVTSFDSASHLRRAWLGSRSNYILPGGRGYAAIRVPQTNRSPAAKKILDAGEFGVDELKNMEDACMHLLREYDKGKTDLDEVLEAVLWYDSLMGDSRDHEDEYVDTLRNMPWRECGCSICRNIGIEVVIFRGNNRNRRRGFHNTKVFYEELQRILAGNIDEPKQTRLEEF
ncbi:hypothetical protein EU520_00770 [Candidatus Thorarchaeota archaeon]|nr:MAG: hypothetical protein EU520_00770 [Candidatus Thorarchaeota archaeon]